MPLIGERGITLLGLSVTNLSDASAVQLSLPLGDTDGLGQSRAALDDALDRLGDRFGSGTVRRASLLRHRLGPEAPRLPDAVRDDRSRDDG
jgi:DNA polymerase-4